MTILLIGANPLFKEVIQEATSSCDISEKIEVEPYSAAARICEINPDVIIIDETIDATRLDEILAAARKLPKTRTILLNPQQNDIVLIHSHRTTLGKCDDLIEAIMNEQICVTEASSSTS